MHDRFYYEIRVVGLKAFLPPLLLWIGIAIFALFLPHNGGPSARFLTAGLEMLLPLASGAITALIVASDAALELQLTLPKQYAVTVPLRLLLLLIWNSLLAFLGSSLIFVFHLEYLPNPHPTTGLGLFLAGQLAWLPSLLACSAFGFCTALFLQSRAASVSLLAGLWLAEIILKDILIQTLWFFPLILFPTTLFPDSLSFSAWQLNRVLVLVVSLVLFLMSWPCLLFSERLLKGSHQE